MENQATRCSIWTKFGLSDAVESLRKEGGAKKNGAPFFFAWRPVVLMPPHYGGFWSKQQENMDLMNKHHTASLTRFVDLTCGDTCFEKKCVRERVRAILINLWPRMTSDAGHLLAGLAGGRRRSGGLVVRMLYLLFDIRDATFLFSFFVNPCKTRTYDDFGKKETKNRVTFSKNRP